MISQPFEIDDHRHLKVCYTLDQPAKNDRRQQLMEYILDVAAAGQTRFTLQEWEALVDEIVHSRLTVGEWLDGRGAFVRSTKVSGETTHESPN
jgi:hypothetical protein|tara:strand:- start:615 stop:893 length:279 start_codon:yes stop_codon:yes gene_type:complete